MKGFSRFVAAGAAASTVVLLLVLHLWRRRRMVSQQHQHQERSLRPLRPPAPAGLGFHQRAVLQHVVLPATLNVTWADVAGLDDRIGVIKRQVIYPMRSTAACGDPLTMPPKGVLLYGPPGCGKTMVAKAIAKDINAVFINFDVSSIKDKFVGETEKMTAALFATANRLQPSVIFVDEADVFLGTRRDSEHGTDVTMKAQFLTLWDGLTTDPAARVLVLAATNRRQAIDAAILRRLPVQLEFPLPELEQRLEILRVTLQHTQLAPDVDLSLLAERTEGFSGSDLYELCRYAAITRLVRQAEGHSGSSGSLLSERDSLGPLSMGDFLDALTNARDIGENNKPPSHMYM